MSLGFRVTVWVSRKVEGLGSRAQTAVGSLRFKALGLAFEGAGVAALRFCENCCRKRCLMHNPPGISSHMGVSENAGTLI